MESNQILQADLLDILFEGRNKEYGAYPLRKEYNQRLVKAFGVSIVLLLSFIFLYTLSNLHRRTTVRPIESTIVDLMSVITPPPVKEPQAPKPSRALAPHHAVVIPFATPKIIPDNQPIKPAEKMVEQKELDNKVAGVSGQSGGDEKGGAFAGPSGIPNGSGTAPAKEEEGNENYGEVTESFYPGDTPAWQRYLYKNFRYPDAAVDAGIEGTVLVRFIVDKEGNVSDVEAISGPENGGLREEAVRVIRKSGKWKPAIQNGHPVKSYKSQPIIFRLANQ